LYKKYIENAEEKLQIMISKRILEKKKPNPLLKMQRSF